MQQVDLDPKEIARELARLPEEDRARLLAELPDDVVIEILYDWEIWARDKQRLPQGEGWFIWLLLSGRGFGKTRTGAETTRHWVEKARDARSPIILALVAQTAADARDVMVEGESGILAVSHPNFMPKYEPSKRRITWPDGSWGTLYAGDEPGQLRGPQSHKAWVDELAKYQYPVETWDNLEFGLRLGEHPQVVVTTTPKPIPLLVKMLKDPMVIVTTGSSYENKANLAPSFIKRIIGKYEGTRLGQQEIHGKILDDIKGSLWTWSMIEGCRTVLPEKENWIRVVIGVDPAVTSTLESDEVGLTVGILAYDPIRNKKFCYLVKDASDIMSPHQWAKAACELYKTWEGDRIVGEVNNGGDLVEVNIRTVNQTVPYKAVRASRGKHIRAEPIAGLYEQGLVKHCGNFPELEEQLTFFTREKYVGPTSPDRAEAWIWTATDLMLGPGGEYDPEKWTTVQK